MPHQFFEAEMDEATINNTKSIIQNFLKKSDNSYYK